MGVVTVMQVKIERLRQKCGARLMRRSEKGRLLTFCRFDIIRTELFLFSGQHSCFRRLESTFIQHNARSMT